MYIKYLYFVSSLKISAFNGGLDYRVDDFPKKWLYMLNAKILEKNTISNSYLYYIVLYTAFRGYINGKTPG